MAGQVTTATIEDVFQYHAPDDIQREKFEKIRAAALNFGQVILAECPGCADQQAAIRKVREALMTANAAVATRGAC